MDMYSFYGFCLYRSACCIKGITYSRRTARVFNAHMRFISALLLDTDSFSSYDEIMRMAENDRDISKVLKGLPVHEGEIIRVRNTRAEKEMKRLCCALLAEMSETKPDSGRIFRMLSAFHNLCRCMLPPSEQMYINEETALKYAEMR